MTMSIMSRRTFASHPVQVYKVHVLTLKLHEPRFQYHTHYSGKVRRRVSETQNGEARTEAQAVGCQSLDYAYCLLKEEKKVILN